MNDFQKRKFGLGFLLLFYFLIGYTFTAHFSYREPQVLPLSLVDQWLPLVPWTIWIYMSEYFLFVFLVFLVNSERMMERIFISFAFCLTVSFFVFYFYPTMFVRTEPQGNDIHVWALNFLRSWETPRNCFPSLHIALCYLASFCFLGYSRKWLVFFLIWSSVVAVSTITTEQHYFVDFPAGLVLAVISFGMSLLWVPYDLRNPSVSSTFLYNWLQNGKKAFEKVQS